MTLESQTYNAIGIASMIVVGLFLATLKPTNPPPMPSIEFTTADAVIFTVSIAPQLARTLPH